ncbi:class I SAM-dependent methyltransferase [Psychromonas aquatilis]|uniref:Class I SAM-dependent methyltransferase n=1 Tax=Psychromonas aquatilis TaxID=2005072 RepID=A0ABU9GRB0_9GAMM
MKQNIYDDPGFFDAYSKMPRSINGLKSAGEWEIFREILPALHGKTILDLGCGYGWHCQYASEKGARRVVGIDLSEKMLAKAKKMTTVKNIEYQQCAIEDFDSHDHVFDIIFSSLALHYVSDLGSVFQRASNLLVSGGTLCYSVEHPVFTSNESQDWCYKNEEIQHWPLDNYFHEGERFTSFLGTNVVKYHRTVETHIKLLLTHGFEITALLEPTPPKTLIEKMGWESELRRPMMLIIKAVKK